MSLPPAAGLLVAFEGIDGSGKTTQAALLGEWGRGLGFEVVATKEPTAGKWGSLIRQSKFTKRMDAAAELDCFVQDRKEHVATLIQPALARGALVIVDRYYYSTVAYQGARGLDPAEVLALNRAFAPVPDLVVLLDLDPKAGLQRVHTRGLGQDLFETLDELTRARAIFQSLTDSHVARIDGSQSVAEVTRAIDYQLIAGPFLRRMAELQTLFTIPTGGDPSYRLLALAHQLAADPSKPRDEQLRLLRAAAAR